MKENVLKEDTPLADIVGGLWRRANQAKKASGKNMTKEEMQKLVEEMGPLPTHMAPDTAEVALARVRELESAINSVLAEDMDDVCWMDVYVKLGKLVGREFDPLKLPRPQFERNCARFTDDLYLKRPYSQDALTEYMHSLTTVAGEHREAKTMLERAGYGGTGATLLERLKEALDVLESSDNQDVPGEDN